MASRTKRWLKAFIIRWELLFWGAAAVVMLLSIPVLIFVLPNVSNLTLTIFVLVGSVLSTVGSFASAVKANDTLE